jgi:hypothetical protein
VHPPVPRSVRLFYRRDRPPGGAVGAGEPHGSHFFVDHVGADAAFRAFHEFFYLRQVFIDHFGAVGALAGGGAGGAEGDVAGDRVVVAADEFGRPPVTAGEVVRLQDFHGLLVALHARRVNRQT